MTAEKAKRAVAGLRPKPLSSTSAERRRARALLAALEAEYPDAHCELNYSTPHELLVATILSAQCTDVAVNKATPALFAAFPAPEAFARATPEAIEPYIRSLGFFRSKARAIHESMSVIVREHGGRVPDEMDELLKLRGVARKTANVVMGNAFGKSEGVVVDTHVSRLAVRLGLARAGDPVARIEERLMALFPREKWTLLSHLLIFHGRRACTARTKRCEHPICKRFGVSCPGRNPDAG